MLIVRFQTVTHRLILALTWSGSGTFGKEAQIETIQKPWQTHSLCIRLKSDNGHVWEKTQHTLLVKAAAQHKAIIQRKNEYKDTCEVDIWHFVRIDTNKECGAFLM